jgi:hypothetical protein
MNLPLLIDATKEEVRTAMEFYANDVAIKSKAMLETTGSILQELSILTDMLDRLLKLSSNIQQLTSDNNIRAEKAVFRINCHMLCLIGAANDLNSSIKIENNEELLDDVYHNAIGVLAACRHLS